MVGCGSVTVGFGAEVVTNRYEFGPLCFGVWALKAVPLWEECRPVQTASCRENA